MFNQNRWAGLLVAVGFVMSVVVGGALAADMDGTWVLESVNGMSDKSLGNLPVWIIKGDNLEKLYFDASVLSDKSVLTIVDDKCELKVTHVGGEVLGWTLGAWITQAAVQPCSFSFGNKWYSKDESLSAFRKLSCFDHADKDAILKNWETAAFSKQNGRCYVAGNLLVYKLNGQELKYRRKQ